MTDEDLDPATPRPPRFVRPPPPPLGRDCALFLDIDGTLAELAQAPDAVRIDAGIVTALPRLLRELDGALALVTGRAITSADTLFPGLKLPMAGQHGCERRDADGAIHLHASVKTTQTKLRKLLTGLAKRHKHLLLEDKGASLALHYRSTPHLASHVHQTLRRSLGEHEGYELQPGKMLLEVRPEGRDKGTAIVDFMAENPFAGRLPVFVGDDRTDEHGFDAVERLGGWSIKVGPGRTAARFRLPDPTAVRRWLLAPMADEPSDRATDISGDDTMNDVNAGRNAAPGAAALAHRTLDLALIGNGRVGALVDAQATVVWACFPTLDGDPMFCALLDTTPPESARGLWTIELVDAIGTEQAYAENSALLVTRMTDRAGGTIEITDCAPRFLQHGRLFQPMTLLRQVRRVAGNPRVIVRLRPACRYGSAEISTTIGSNHIRYVAPDLTLRLTTDVSLTAVLEERAFFLDDAITMILGADETITEDIRDLGRTFVERTLTHWHEWVRGLAIPYEWQAAVIRAAITLKLNAVDDTGAIVAAMTTSIPEAPDSGRNWDYRFCWLRDGYFVVNALNRLGATATMERYLGYLAGIAANATNGPIQPVFRISGSAQLLERSENALPGYRGMGPVRVGNDAWRQVQHDVYGSAVLAATQLFFDERLIHRGDVGLFERLEPLGRRAIEMHDQPDAGLWELRGSERVHTFSSVMCWAACDRLARIAARLDLPSRAAAWRADADRIHAFVCARCWNEQRGTFVATVDGDGLDASLLLLADLNFVRADDRRFVGTVAAIEQDLMRGGFVFRYIEHDDFGEPKHAFIVCTFWMVNALAATGRRDEARALFARLLACRNAHGLLAEHVDPLTGEMWGNFVQTYSMVGLINAAIRLSIPWDDAF